MTGGWHFRLIEDGGGWSCRRGRHVIDRHAGLEAALDHIREIAAAHRPSQIFLHHLDGSVVHGDAFS